MKRLFPVVFCILLPGISLCSGGCISVPRTSSPNLDADIARAKAKAQEKDIVAAARSQLGATYTKAYFPLKYPNGDLPLDREGKLQGMGTDVIIRSLRAVGIDLQQLIHDDLKQHYAAYPHRSGHKPPDASIDHRRIPNQMVWMKRHARALPLAVTAKTLAQWQPGDIVYWKLKGDLDHCGIISDKSDAAGIPLVIHNIGGCREEPVLTSWKITGHFRCIPQPAAVTASP